MKRILLGVTLALFASHAVAQTAAQTASQPATRQTTPPKANVGPPPAIGTSDAAAKRYSGKNSPQLNLQMLAVASVLSCTSKTAGPKPTGTLYAELQKVAKGVEAYCKAGQSAQARTLVIQTLSAKENDPAMKVAVSCYEAQADQIAGLAGGRVAEDAAKYARWARYPSLAPQEMAEEDVCRNSN